MKLVVMDRSKTRTYHKDEHVK